MNSADQAVRQATACLRALGFEPPAEPSPRVEHTAPSFKDAQWVVRWGPFELRIADRGVLYFFKRNEGPYRLTTPIGNPPRFKTPDEARRELTRLSHAAGVDPKAFSEFVGWKRFDGAKRVPFSASAVSEYFLSVVAKENGELSGRSTIGMSAPDGAVTTYFLDARFGRDLAQVVKAP